MYQPQKFKANQGTQRQTDSAKQTQETSTGKQHTVYHKLHCLTQQSSADTSSYLHQRGDEIIITKYLFLTEPPKIKTQQKTSNI